MSIIYEALKKTQDGINTRLRPGPVRRWPGRLKPIPWIGLILLAIFLVVYLAKVIFRKPSSTAVGVSLPEPVSEPDKPLILPEEELPPSVSPALALPPPVVETEPPKETPPVLVLNGVFYSQDQAYALINNQIVKEGDVLDGAIVKRISLEVVEIERDGLILRLKPPR
jgi:hypothetical protein